MINVFINTGVYPVFKAFVVVIEAVLINTDNNVFSCRISHHLLHEYMIHDKVAILLLLENAVNRFNKPKIELKPDKPSLNSDRKQSRSSINTENTATT